MFVSGVSGKMTTETADEDDNFGTESSQKACSLNVLIDPYLVYSHLAVFSLQWYVNNV